MNDKRCTRCEQTQPVTEFTKDRQKADGLKTWCRSCVSAAGRKYLAENKEKRRAYYQQWYAANREKQIAATTEWRKANRELYLSYKRAYRERNPEADAEYYAANRDAAVARVRKRRAIKAGATLGPIDADALWTGTCALCGEAMERDLPYPDDFSKSLDHIIPLSRGGKHEQANLQWAHLVCNKKKGATVPYTSPAA